MFYFMPVQSTLLPALGVNVGIGLLIVLIFLVLYLHISTLVAMVELSPCTFPFTELAMENALFWLLGS